jgi:hypothetical protein
MGIGDSFPRDDDDDDDDDDDNNNNISNCKWAVTRWQWLLCMYKYIYMK